MNNVVLMKILNSMTHKNPTKGHKHRKDLEEANFSILNIMRKMGMTLSQLLCNKKSICLKRLITTIPVPNTEKVLNMSVMKK